MTHMHVVEGEMKQKQPRNSNPLEDKLEAAGKICGGNACGLHSHHEKTSQAQPGGN